MRPVGEAKVEGGEVGEVVDARDSNIYLKSDVHLLDASSVTHFGHGKKPSEDRPSGNRTSTSEPEGAKVLRYNNPSLMSGIAGYVESDGEHVEIPRQRSTRPRRFELDGSTPTFPYRQIIRHL